MKKFFIQLFANSTSINHQEGGSTTHEEGGGQSHTVTHSEGGSHAESSGKSWASGKVEDNTQQHRNAYNTDYSEGNKVTDTYNRLQATLDQKPGFQSQYETKLNDLYNQIMNREKFSYNFNADPMYQMYRNNYTQQGQRAMQDTMGQQVALTGGYGNSYAQTVGQQTYQNYLQQLNDRLPELRNMAYQQYQDEQALDLQKYNITSDAYNREYGQYRDSVSDWQADRSFNQAAYQDERNFDYNQFTNERNYWNQEYWNEKNAEHSNYQVTDENNWQDSVSDTTYSNWSDSSTSSWSDSTTNSFSGSGKSGGGDYSGASKNLEKKLGYNDLPKAPTWQDSIYGRTGTINRDVAAYGEQRNAQNSAQNQSSQQNYQNASNAVDLILGSNTAIEKAANIQRLKWEGYSDTDIKYLEELAKQKQSNWSVPMR